VRSILLIGKAELPEIPPGFRYATHVSVLMRNGQRVGRYRKLMTVCDGDGKTNRDPALRSKSIDRGPRDWAQLQRHRNRAKHQLKVEPFCRLCLKKGRATPAQIADPITPHRGDWNSFRLGELQSLCRQCHSSIKQSIERNAWRAVGVDGLPIDCNHPVYQTAQYQRGRMR
jgi:5-methylcytosine-specific restriction endonuclease McrA